MRREAGEGDMRGDRNPTREQEGAAAASGGGWRRSAARLLAAPVAAVAMGGLARAQEVVATEPHPGEAPGAWAFAPPAQSVVPSDAATVSHAEFEALQAQVWRQQQLIRLQQQQIDALRSERIETLGTIRAGSAAAPAALAGPGPDRPVGQKPAEPPSQASAALPAQVSVLTPPGRLILDPSVEYDRWASDRLVFRGVEIVPGVNLGVVDANRTGNDTAIGTLAGRYGLTSRLEFEARLPYVYRHDRVTTVASINNNFQQTTSIYGHGVGDGELDLRYQLNHGQDGWPIFVATSRIKSPTGRGPYDVPYDRDAVALALPTGSGFWAAEGGLTMLYPSDPALVFGSLTYLHNFGRNVNKTFGVGEGALHVGKVDPGDSIGASLGFGLALNPRLSVSFGYNHYYVLRTVAFENSPGKPPARSEFPALVVGSVLMGMSFRVSERSTLTGSLELGVTPDAPDLRLVVRAPYRF